MVEIGPGCERQRSRERLISCAHRSQRPRGQGRSSIGPDPRRSMRRVSQLEQSLANGFRSPLPERATSSTAHRRARQARRPGASDKEFERNPTPSPCFCGKLPHLVRFPVPRRRCVPTQVGIARARRWGFRARPPADSDAADLTRARDPLRTRAGQGARREPTWLERPPGSIALRNPRMGDAAEVDRSPTPAHVRPAGLPARLGRP